MAFRDVNGSGGDASGGGMKNFWSTVGKTVAGRVVGYKNGRAFPNPSGGVRQSRILILDVGNGVQQQIPLPSDLSDDKQIEFNAKPGSIVEITLVELVRTNQPQPYKKFKLRVDDGTDGAPATAPTSSAASTSTAPVVVTQAMFDERAAKLSAKQGPAAATPMLNALTQLYPDLTVRYEQLGSTLKSLGVAV